MKRDERAYRPYSMRWRAALAFLILHLVVYAWIFVSAIWRVFALEWLVGANERAITGVESQIGLAMLWMPLILIHVGVHLYLAGRSNEGRSERQAYRDGFRDGVRQSTEDAYEPRRLTLDDDGELVDWQSERKQKHS